MDRDKEDSAGNKCNWYKDNPSQCGHFDDANFNAHHMCCACKGDI